MTPLFIGGIGMQEVLLLALVVLLFFGGKKAAKTCPTKVYRRIIPSRTTELGKSLPVCGTIVHYPHPSNEYRFNRSDRHGS